MVTSATSESHFSKYPPTALLVLAHNQPELLRVLLSRMRAPWIHAFIHLDKKVKRKQFEALIEPANYHTFVPDELRVGINYCGFSMVRASLNLLRLALNDPRGFSRFSLMSGVDLPIKSLDDIAMRFDSDEEIIRIDQKLVEWGNDHYDRCANRYFLGDNKWLHPRSKMIRLAKFARTAELKLLRRYPDNLQIYYGPSWWSLTRAGATEVLRFADQRPDAVRWFQHTRSPDEMFFQTALKRSALAARISYDASRGDKLDWTTHGTHYVYWDQYDRSAPKTLELSDMEPLLRSEAVFARKFEWRKSADLIAALAELRP